MVNDVRHCADLKISAGTTVDVIDILTDILADKCLDRFPVAVEARINLDKVTRKKNNYIYTG